jgi:hypothetical protein
MPNDQHESVFQVVNAAGHPERFFQLGEALAYLKELYWEGDNEATLEYNHMDCKPVTAKEVFG